jgi:hypothetical protein
MTLDTIRGALFPTLEDVEPRFREEIERVAVIGVRAIAAVCIGAPLFTYALGVLLLPSFPTPTLVIADFVGFLVGAAALAVSFWRDLRPHARWLGFVLGATTALVQTIGTTSAASFQWEVLKTTPEAQFPTIFGIVILIGVAVLPLKPVHTLTLGIFMLGLFTIAIYVRHGLAGLPRLVPLSADRLGSDACDRARAHNGHVPRARLGLSRQASSGGIVLGAPKGPGFAPSREDRGFAEPIRRRAQPRAQLASRIACERL